MEKIYKNEQDVFAEYTTAANMAHIDKLETIPEFVGYIHAVYTGRQAVCTHTGRLFTYARLFQDVMKVCTVLENNGIKAGQNVSIFMKNSYRFIVCALAIMTHGSVAVPIPDALQHEQVDAIAKKYDSVAIISDNVIEESKGGFTTKTLWAHEFLDEKYSAGPTRGFGMKVQPNDPAVILLTGGTTGMPKGVILSHTALMRGTMNGVLGLPEPWHETYYALIPFTHSFGFVRNMLCSLYTGSLLYMNRDKSMIFKELSGYKPTILCIVPALAELFLSLIKLHGPNFVGGNLRTIICGAANVPPYLVEEYNKLGINFCPGYGLTEFSNLVSGNPRSALYPSSVGLLFPEQEAKIVDGELLLKGRNMTSGYYKNDEANKAAFTPDGWFKTGDLAKFDENNNLYIIGRKSDTIVLSNGKKVEPAEIEAQIATLNLVQDCLVMSEQSEGGGTTYIKAEVLLRPMILKDSGMDAEQARSVVQKHIDNINSKLPDYAQIAKVEIRKEDFARSPSMKIIRPKR